MTSKQARWFFGTMVVIAIVFMVGVVWHYSGEEVYNYPHGLMCQEGEIYEWELIDGFTYVAVNSNAPCFRHRLLIVIHRLL